MCPIMSMKSHQVMCEFESGAPEVHNSSFVKLMHSFCLAQVIAPRQFGKTSVAQLMRDLVQGFQVPLCLGASRGKHTWLCCWSASPPQHHWYVPITAKHRQWLSLPRRMAMAWCLIHHAKQGCYGKGGDVSELL